MDFANLKSLTIPEGEVAEITCNGVLLWKGGYTNLVPLSTEADGKTIYNNGLGYKNRYRVRSSGAEAASNTSACVGFIKATAGDIVRLSGYDVKNTAGAQNAINVYDGNRTNLGQIVGNNTISYGCFNGTGINWDDVIAEGNGVYYWVIPSGYGIEYIRVTGYTNDGSKMIVTVNEEITE